MSSKTIQLNNGRQAIIDTDVSKVFVGENRYQKDNYTNNSSYDPNTLLAGTVMGRISASNIVVPLQSTAGDGSQLPVGILADDIQLAGGSTQQVTLVDMGDVAAYKLLFAKPGDGLDTVVSGRRLKDHLAAQGLKLVYGEEMTAPDNH